jgi:RNA polymerase sigma factor (sigma-70 family)
MASARRETGMWPIDRLFGEGTLAGLSDVRLLERYVVHRDELAFEALVRRHGTMVLGVCRRVLNDPNDADDAFQAAFLLLARKARSIWVDGSLGGWLHRVAWRIALQVKADAARRSDRERRAAERTREAITSGLGWEDTAVVIHQEIDRLPERYRKPVVLCYLEDMTYQQAAAQLGWSEATIRGRLVRARDLLRVRLSRRGVTLAGVALGVAGLAALGTAAPVPAALLRAAVRSARQLALGESAAAVSATTIALMKQAARSMMITRFKSIAAAALLVAALTGLAAVVAATGIAGDERMPAASPQVMKGDSAPAVAVAPTRPGKGETRSIRGRVLAPDGQPAAGAEVFVVVNLPRPLTMSVETSRTLGPARTDAEGRFLLEVPRKLFDNYCMADMVAYRPGYASGLHGSIPDEGTDVTIRLDRERPVRVHLLDLEGRPASRVRVRVAKLSKSRRPASRAMGMAMHGMAMRSKSGATVFLTSAPDRPLPGWLGMMIADEQGRLTIPGLARDEQVILEVLDDRFAVQRVRIGTGRGVANGPAEPTFTLTPAHWLEGRVRLGESGPIATGATFLVISHSKPEEDPQGIRIRGQTDTEGRFRVNVPRCERHEVLVYPPGGSPFAFRRVEVAATQGVSQPVEITLPRGVVVKGRVVESPSGRAVAGAILEYRPRRAGNPNFQKGAVADRGGYEPTAVTGPDGSFRIGVLPGPGHLLVEAPESVYIAAETSDGAIKTGVPGGPRLYPDGLLAVDAPAGAEVEAAVTLRRGKSLRGRLIDPEGRPAVDAGVVERGGLDSLPAGKGEFELAGLDPEKPVTVYFLDAENQLARIVTFSRPDFDRPVTVQLQRCGSARARFIDAQGQPFANARIEEGPRPSIHLEMTFADRSPGNRDASPNLEIERTLVGNFDSKHYDPLVTDAQGWVTYPTLIPGATYRILAGEASWVTKKQFIAEAGRTLELGEITVSPYP